MFEIDIGMSMGHREAVTVLSLGFLYIQSVMAHIMVPVVVMS